MLSTTKDIMEITHLICHSQIIGNKLGVDSIIQVKQDGKHGLISQAWTNKKLWWTSNTWLTESVMTKVLIAQIHCMKNGKENSINAITLKIRWIQMKLKMIFVKVMKCVTKVNVVVLLQVTMKMGSKKENCMSVTKRILLNGWTIWTGKHSTHSNALTMSLLKVE